MLTDALTQGAKALEAFAAAMASLSNQPAAQVDIGSAEQGALGDRLEAEAIKRGQKPEVIAALRKALGL
jgi:hypothetical protein